MWPAPEEPANAPAEPDAEPTAASAAPTATPAAAPPPTVLQQGAADATAYAMSPRPMPPNHNPLGGEWGYWWW